MNEYTLNAIRSVKDYLDKHPISKKTITELANDVNIGRNMLQTGFKALFKYTITNYQLQVRMALTRQLLEEGILSKKEIAHRCGYDSHSSFDKYFKKIHGMTPTEWQNREKWGRRKNNGNN